MLKWYIILFRSASCLFCIHVRVAYCYSVVVPHSSRYVTYSYSGYTNSLHDHTPQKHTFTYGTKRKQYFLTLFATSKSRKKSNSRNTAAVGFGASSSTPSKRSTEADSITTSINPIIDNDNVQSSVMKTDTVAATTTTTIQKDKWGLPPPTLEDIFPLLSNETRTELIPFDPTIQYTITDIQNYLQEYYPNNINWNYVHIKETFDPHRNDVSSTNDVSSDIDTPNKMTLRLTHCSPPVLMIENFLSVEECNDIQRIVTENEQRSTGGNNNDDSSDRNDDDNVVRVASKTISQQLALSKRTSTSWFCSYKSIPTVLAKIQHILGVHDLSRCEEPQIVRYDIGQEFTYHYDILPKEQTMNGGQRVATILIYLNTIAETNGGSTTFRDLIDGQNNNNNNKNTTLSVQPVQGSALIFYPSNQNGQRDDRTLHRSVPIISDDKISLPSKWILQIWIHESSYTACLPSKQNQIDNTVYDDIDAASRQLGYIS